MSAMPPLFWLVIAVIAVGVIVVAGRRVSAKPAPPPRRVAGAEAVRAQADSNAVAHHWLPTGDFAFSVVGESHYQAALKKLAGEHGKKKARVECIAQLTPDDANRYDDKTVAVTVNGAQVGNLSREDARKFRRRLGQKGLTGQATFCNAIVLGGGEWRGEARFYGIQLDLKPFD